MNSSDELTTLRWLIVDTFRQSLASGIFWVMLAVTGVVILFCLSVGITDSPVLKDPTDRIDFLPKATEDSGKLKRSGVTELGGKITLAFGAITLPLGRNDEEAVQFLQLVLAGGVADAVGLLLALVWTAGFLPSFLDVHNLAVLLAKPIPRRGLLLGKFLGILVFVAVQALLFVGGTWIALGIRTGVWNPLYLVCIPILLIHFFIFFGFSALLAVYSRSTVLCVVGSLVFWLLCWGVNFGRHALVTAPATEQTAAAPVIETAYWILPKPADFGIILYNAIEAGKSFGQHEELQALQKREQFYPAASVFLSLLFACLTFLFAGRKFLTTDY